MELVKYAELAKKVGQTIPWLYKIASQTYIDKTFPRHIFIETTAKCNLTCSYCPREDRDEHMEFSIFRRIVDEASRYGPRSFSLHLFGEPLLWPRIIDGIRFIKQCNRKHNICLTTNGTHLNRFVDRLISEGVDEILWTWRTEAKFRPETLERLRKATVEGKTRFRVRLIKELTPPEEFERWKEWPYVDIKNMHNYGGDIDLSSFGAQPVETRWPCYHLWLAPAVAWNGNILICCSDPHQESILGNIMQSTIAEAWTSEKMNSYRNAHMRGIYPKPCIKCDVFKTYDDIWFNFQKKSQS